MRENIQKQMEVFDFILKEKDGKGYPPSVREICKAVNLKSTSTVFNILNQLEESGRIRRDKTKPRAIEILDDPHSTKGNISIPIVGKITAGLPILAVENIEDHFSISINKVPTKNELFILNVTGESMIEAGIFDGDLVIIEKTSVAKDGDVIVALIGNEATLKEFYKEENRIRLQPRNSSMEPIYVDTCEILGKLAGLYRQY